MPVSEYAVIRHFSHTANVVRNAVGFENYSPPLKQKEGGVK